MKDRLIELLTAFKMDVRLRCPKYETPTCEGCQYDLGLECDKTAILTDYLLANGVIVPPCKVGDTVYQFVNWCDYTNCHFEGCAGCSHCNDLGIKEICFNYSHINQLGKTIFVTKEEAEKEFERRKK